MTQPKTKTKSPNPLTHNTSPTFKLRRLKAKTGFSRPYCHNMHPGPRIGSQFGSRKGTNMQRKIAAYELDILGYPTFLCQKCAKEWKQIWDDALE